MLHVSLGLYPHPISSTWSGEYSCPYDVLAVMQLLSPSFLPLVTRSASESALDHGWCSQCSSWEHLFREQIKSHYSSYWKLQSEHKYQSLSYTIRNLCEKEWLEGSFYRQGRFWSTESVTLAPNSLHKFFAQVPGGRFTNAKWCWRVIWKKSSKPVRCGELQLPDPVS